VEAVARGKYLVMIAGCNDCHTPDYLMKNGDVPETRWLIGDSLGWNGPWGTTYATNLRLLFQTLTEDEWVTRARQQQMRPPMPWHVLRELTESDLRAIYLYVHQLAGAGVPAPDYLPPGEVPKTAYFTLIVPAEE
jgi:mono/diheme cytochrome c family protein